VFLSGGRQDIGAHSTAAKRNKPEQNEESFCLNRMKKNAAAPYPVFRPLSSSAY
jgi:hypothetical protein